MKKSRPRSRLLIDDDSTRRIAAVSFTTAHVANNDVIPVIACNCRASDSQGVGDSFGGYAGDDKSGTVDISNKAVTAAAAESDLAIVVDATATNTLTTDRNYTIINAFTSTAAGAWDAAAPATGANCATPTTG